MGGTAGGSAPPHWSPDKRWWWDGTRWLPASAGPPTRTPAPIASERPDSSNNPFGRSATPTLSPNGWEWRRRPNKRLLAVLGALGVLVVGSVALINGSRSAQRRAGTARTSSTTPAPRITPSASATASAGGAGQEICRAAVGTGTYYLIVTSAADRNFSACAGDTGLTGTLGDLFTQPGMDRRCIIDSAEARKRNDATVAVYSDGRRPDVSAARAYCRTQGGTANA